MASARIFFSKHRKHRNGFINEEVPVVENGYDVHESDEDEVFVQDPHLEISASKPLMHPRSKGQRTKVKTRSIECGLCTVCKPIFYFVALVSVLCGAMATIVYIANKHKNQSNAGAVLQGAGPLLGGVQEKQTIVGCDQIEVEDVWVVGFPKLLTESAFRLVDINKDGTLDIVFGFATGADGYGVKDIVCDIYFQGLKPCFGGVIALEGATGKELWRIYTRHEIYGLNCQYDINKDGVKDCLAAGRAATFVAISCSDGSLLWELQNHKAVNPVMNMYTPQYISDVDGDNIADIIIIHGGDPLQEAGSAHRLSGRILVVSGRTGAVLRWAGVPDRRESYYSPQLLMRQDGSRVLLFGTGGETHNGSLWSIDVANLFKGRMDMAVKLSSDTHKGFMTPPALADVTHDGVEDIIVPMYNSTLLAINGESFMPLWSVRFPSSETYSTPAVGFYNDDDVADFLVKYAHGPGYPVYYYSETTVIDGKTGQKLIDPPLRDTIGGQASPLTISMEGLGNDVFLVWMAECKGHEGATDEFSFVKGTSSSDKSWSNLCRLRFNSEGFSRLMAVSSQHSKPGIPIYNSADRKIIEHSKWLNTSAEAYEYIMKHPEIIDGFTSGLKVVVVREKYKEQSVKKTIVTTPSRHLPENDEEGYSRSYHVQCFGKEKNRSWINKASLLEFEGRDKYLDIVQYGLDNPQRNSKPPSEFMISTAWYPSWSLAVTAAEAASKLDLQQRKLHYTFEYVVARGEAQKPVDELLKVVGYQSGGHRGDNDMSDSDDDDDCLYNKLFDAERERGCYDSDDFFSSDESSTCTQDKPHKNPVKVQVRQGVLQVYINKQHRFLQERHPDWHPAFVTEYLKKLWSVKSSLQRSRYVSKHQKPLFVEVYRSQRYVSSKLDNLPTVDPLTLDLQVEKLSRKWHIPKSSKSCLVCELPGPHLVCCKGPCARYFHAACMQDIRDNTSLCLDCHLNATVCFVCKQPGIDMVQCISLKCQKYYHEVCVRQLPLTVMDKAGFLCPLHICVTCHVEERPGAREGCFVECLRCPTAYHCSDWCLVAGTQLMGKQHMVCADHFQPSRGCSQHSRVHVRCCLKCGGGGSLRQCHQCPAAFHKMCDGISSVNPRRINFKPDCGTLPAGMEVWLCSHCLSRRKLIYGDIVWVKHGIYRWWPAEICHPQFVPKTIQVSRHQLGEFPVRFFGSQDFAWLHQGRVLSFDRGITSLRDVAKNVKDQIFIDALRQATAAARFCASFDRCHQQM